MAEGTGAGSRSKDTLKASMLEVFPGVVLHDRDLELCNADGATASRSPRAAFVGLDAEQRLVLVLHARDPDGESPALLCLDALAFASENASALAQHLGRPDLRSDAPARIILVVSHLNPRLARRLCALHAEIEVCELRTLRTASSSARYLVPVALSSTQRIAACAPDAQSFAASLPQEQRELAERLLSRMSRVDEEIVARFVDRWDWTSLSGNEKLPWSGDFIEAHADRWDWSRLSRNDSLPWDRELLERFRGRWDWDYSALYARPRISEVEATTAIDAPPTAAMLAC